jgi:enoyl-CoA hydratase
MRTTLESRDGVAWITLDDGKVNAMSFEMLSEIARQLDEAMAAGGPVVLQGRPGMFSAGFDLKTFALGPEAARDMVLAGVGLIQAMLAYPRPIATVCTGHAYPMGAFLMLSADVRFGIAGPWRIGMNEVAIGLTVPRFAIELARHRLTPAGFGRVSTAAMFDPVEAVQQGYLDYCLAAEEIDAAVYGELQRLKKLDWKSYEATKARLNEPVARAIAAAAAEYQQRMVA